MTFRKERVCLRKSPWRQESRAEARLLELGPGSWFRVKGGTGYGALALDWVPGRPEVSPRRGGGGRGYVPSVLWLPLQTSDLTSSQQDLQTYRLGK